MYKDVKGYEGYYQVDENGNVRSLRRFRKNGATGYFQEGKELKKTDRGNGYLCVNLSKDGKTRIHSIHRLVAETFLEKIEGKTQVNHKDGNKYNNSVHNLEWCTCKENINHCDENLGRKRNFDGLKLGSIVTTKNNLNIKVNGKIFQTYKSIKDYLELELGKKLTLKQVQNNVRKCCTGQIKTAFGMKFEYVK